MFQASKLQPVELVMPWSTSDTRHSPTLTLVVEDDCNAIVPCAPFVACHVNVHRATTVTGQPPTPPVRAGVDRHTNVYSHPAEADGAAADVDEADGAAADVDEADGAAVGVDEADGGLPAPTHVNDATTPPPPSGSPTGSPIDHTVEVNLATADTVNPPAVTDARNTGCSCTHNPTGTFTATRSGRTPTCTTGAGTVNSSATDRANTAGSGGAAATTPPAGTHTSPATHRCPSGNPGNLDDTGHTADTNDPFAGSKPAARAAPADSCS